MKRRISKVIIVLIAGLMSITVWGINFVPYIYCNLYNIDQAAYYIDLLLPISESDEAYTTFNQENGTNYSLTPNSQIVTYNIEGFKSYTFHFKNATSKMQIYDIGEANNKENEIVYFADDYYLNQKNKMQYEVIEEKYKKIKLAVLDKQGNVLQVSESQYIIPNYWFETRFGIDYDVANNKLDVEFYNGLPWIMVALCYYSWKILLLMVAICLLEKIIVLIYNRLHNAQLAIRPNYL